MIIGIYFIIIYLKNNNLIQFDLSKLIRKRILNKGYGVYYFPSGQHPNFFSNIMMNMFVY